VGQGIRCRSECSWPGSAPPAWSASSASESGICCAACSHASADAARAVAAELGIDPPALQRLVRERGLAAEIESLRERFREQARRRRWPREQIEQLVRRRGWLDDLGIAGEVEREVLSRARPAWERSGGSLARFRKELRIAEPEARALRDLL